MGFSDCQVLMPDGNPLEKWATQRLTPLANALCELQPRLTADWWLTPSEEIIDEVGQVRDINPIGPIHLSSVRHYGRFATPEEIINNVG